ncbi:MAG: histidine phosphatase family protein [Firmicutes bacterium]|nr:histidine phosphatase family protein [Bacillota bacterium]
MPIQAEHKKAYISFYGQETLIDFRARTEKVLAKIINEYPQESKVAIVSHGNMINMLFRGEAHYESKRCALRRINRKVYTMGWYKS